MDKQLFPHWSIWVGILRINSCFKITKLNHLMLKCKFYDSWKSPSASSDLSIKTSNDYEFVVENLTDSMCTRSGSVELQAELDWDTLFLPTLLLQSVESRLADACRDTYGNYVVQKLLPLLSDNQISHFILLIQKAFISIAITVPGSCVLTSLIEECQKRGLQSELIPLFNSNLVLLHQYSTVSHVLRR